jgi:polyphosphate kinase 2 (PPK2 family)
MEIVSPQLGRAGRAGCSLPTPSRQPVRPISMERLDKEQPSAPPAAGEVVILDRSWYKRAGVERVMGCLSRRANRFSR